MAGNAPDVSALSLNAPPSAQYLTDLPEVLYKRLLVAVEAGDPCAEVAKLCSVKREWAQLCRTGQIYDWANKSLGFYGEYPSLEAIRRATANDLTAWHPSSDPKVYFQEACRYARMASRRALPDNQAYMFTNYVPGPWPDIDMSVMRRPYFEAFAKRLVKRMPNWIIEVVQAWDMRAANVPADRQRAFWRIAKAAVQANGQALYHVQLVRDAVLQPEYEEIARLAIAESPRSLTWVPPEAPWYMDAFRSVLRRYPMLLLDMHFNAAHNLDVEQYADMLLYAREQAQRHADEARERITEARAEREERLREAHGNPDHPGAQDAATLRQWIDQVLMPDYARAREEMEVLNAPEPGYQDVWYV